MRFRTDRRRTARPARMRKPSRTFVISTLLRPGKTATGAAGHGRLTLFVCSYKVKACPPYRRCRRNQQIQRSRNRGGNAVMRRTMLASLPAAARSSGPGSADHCRGADDLLDLGQHRGRPHPQHHPAQSSSSNCPPPPTESWSGSCSRTAKLYSGRDVPRAVARGDVDNGRAGDGSISGRSSPNWAVLDLPIYSALASEDFFGIVDGEIGQTVVEATEERLGVEIPGRLAPARGDPHLRLRRADRFPRGAGGPAHSHSSPWRGRGDHRRLFRAGRRCGDDSASATCRWRCLRAPSTASATKRMRRSGPASCGEGAGLTSVYENNMQTLFYVPMVSESFWNGLSEDQQAIFAGYLGLAGRRTAGRGAAPPVGSRRHQ